jgi:outer membrane immunogenic protein
MGFNWGPALFYLKGGGALAYNKFEYRGAGMVTGIDGSASRTYVGGIAGLGFEWAFMPNASAFIEYDHYFFSNNSVTFSYLSGAATSLTTISQGVDAVKGGLNLRFNFGSRP